MNTVETLESQATGGVGGGGCLCVCVCCGTKKQMARWLWKSKIRYVFMNFMLIGYVNRTVRQSWKTMLCVFQLFHWDHVCRLKSARQMESFNSFNSVCVPSVYSVLDLVVLMDRQMSVCLIAIIRLKLYRGSKLHRLVFNSVTVCIPHYMPRLLLLIWKWRPQSASCPQTPAFLQITVRMSFFLQRCILDVDSGRMFAWNPGLQVVWSLYVCLVCLWIKTCFFE